MTPKQKDKIVNKIKKIKAALAADKKQWGGYHHDGQGLRYAPPRLYIQLGDFSGGLRYLNWFNKNFPDDSCYPDFLFEWTLILFKTGRQKEAEKKAFLTFTQNTYLFDKFFGRPIKPVDKWEYSNLEMPEFVINYFDYFYQQENLVDFAEWLDKLIQSENFKNLCDQYIEIYKRLQNENDIEIRRYLLKQANQLENLL